MENTIQQQVKDWLNTMNYETGIVILLQYRPRMARQFAGRSTRYASKLEYELKKIAGLDHISALVKKAESQNPAPITPVSVAKKKISPDIKNNLPGELENTEELTPPPSNPKPSGFNLGAAHLDNVPPEIELIVKEHSRLFTLRSRLAEQREKLGDSNKPSVVKERKVLTQAIHTHSERIEILFHAHAEYLRTQKIPDVNNLFPQNTLIKDEGLNIDEIKAERKKLLSANQRDRVWLLYNNAQRQKTPNLMPKGPRRINIETRMAERTERIKEIDIILKK